MKQKKKYDKENTIRYKIINNKKSPLCDHSGTCTNLAYKEVYPYLGEKKFRGWSYLCKKHFNQEKKRIGKKLVYCNII